MSGQHAVDIADLVHRYGDRVALDRVSFTVEAPSIFGLLGPNGGGKTTLFKILATLLRPASGSAHVGGVDVVSNPAAVRSKIGVVFQNPSVDGKLSVLENLHHHGMLYGLSGALLKVRCAQQLDRFGLSDRAGDRVEALSGGLRRRVELAKSLLHGPSILILDEPSTGLDPGARISLMDELHQLRDRDGVTCLLTTHLLEEADHCDRLAILDHGKVVAIGTPDALKQAIGGEVITVRCADAAGLGERLGARFKTTAEVVDGTLRLEVANGHAMVPEMIEAFPGEIDSITVGRPTLEDVFVHVTGRRFWSGGAE